ASKRVQHRAEIAQGFNRLSVQFQRGIDQARGLRAVALLLAQDSEEMQRVEMVRPDLENGGVELFGLGEHPALMKYHGAFGIRFQEVFVVSALQRGCHLRPSFVHRIEAVAMDYAQLPAGAAAARSFHIRSNAAPACWPYHLLSRNFGPASIRARIRPRRS